MGNTKKIICMMTTWYPTKENPYNGVFFKDQALALADDFEFLILHYEEKKNDPILRYAIRSLKNKTISIEKINTEGNTVEYNVTAYMPLYILFANKIYDFYKKYVRHDFVTGVGEYYSPDYCKRKKNIMKKIFQYDAFSDIDAFYCVNAQSESFSLQCASEATGKPYVVSEHAPFPWPGDWLRDAEKTAIEKADLLLAISYDKIRQVLLQNVKPQKIRYVGNLVDETKFVPGKAEDREKTFVIVAAHSFYKNYDLFVEIFNRLTGITNAPFKVKIVGYASNKGYSKNAEELEAKIHHSKFSRYAELIPEVSHEEIPAIYASADAFVMTSIQEGMPVSALEAACCGLPIFSTRCGGVEDYVTDEIGRVYKIIDSEAFANGLKDYLEGNISFDSQYIRNYIIAHYGKTAFTERMKACFDEVVRN